MVERNICLQSNWYFEMNLTLINSNKVEENSIKGIY